MDTTKAITHIGLCAGYGGIELGLGRVLPTLRSVALCEIEAFPIANLVAKMEAGLMEPAPVWTDLKSFPWESFRDRVDILTGGYPCQPFSAAGKRAGKDDSRHLWTWIADGIQILRPRMCFFENVEGHITLGLREVIGELEEIGYKTAWGIFSASEVGAPHQRKRVFILAHRKCKGLEGLHNWDASAESSEYERANTWASRKRDIWPSRPGEPQHAWEPPRVFGNTDSRRFSSSIHTRSGEETDRGGQGYIEQADGSAMGNSESPDVRKMFRDYRGESGEVSDTQQIESGGGDCGSLRDCDREIEPTLGRDSHGTSDWMDYAELYTTCDNRTDELRLLGNGVVPATAERAFRTLLKDLI